MSGDIEVISYTQKIIVNPAKSSVSIIKAGPIGPTGAAGATGPVNNSVLTTDGDLMTRTAGVVARMTRATLAADTAFTTAFAPRSGFGPASAIIENATTPAGVAAYEIRFSTFHQALMIWNGTQWFFLDDHPANLAYIERPTFNVLSSGSAAPISSVTRHNMVYRITSGAATNSGAYWVLPDATFALDSSVGLRSRFVFSLPSVAANTHQMLGFHDVITVATPVDGAWMDITAGVMSFKASQASTATTHGTTATLTANTWYYGHILFPTASTVRCVIMKEDGTLVYDQTITTNVPTGSNRFGLVALAYMATNTTGTNVLDMDSMAWGKAPI